MGGTITLGSGILSRVVRDLRAEQPDLDIYSYMNNTQIIEQKLLNMELDVGIVEGRVKSRDLVSIPLIDDMLVLACGQNHLFFGRHTLFINELNGHDFVKREPGSGTRELFENFIVRHGLDIHTVFEESTPDSIKMPYRSTTVWQSSPSAFWKRRSRTVRCMYSQVLTRNGTGTSPLCTTRTNT
ncbi:hypothetical protein LC724_13495 [Blautia sp. RD014234]|nr:hypothetical protein [Blautia parvula]